MNKIMKIFLVLLLIINGSFQYQIIKAEGEEAQEVTDENSVIFNDSESESGVIEEIEQNDNQEQEIIDELPSNSGIEESIETPSNSGYSEDLNIQSTSGTNEDEAAISESGTKERVCNLDVEEIVEEITKAGGVSVIEYGPCGDNAMYYVTNEGTLEVRGIGETWDYDYSGLRSEIEDYYNIEKIVIEEGITSIGENIFNDFYNAKVLELPSTLKTIKEEAFRYLAIETLSIPSSVETIGEYAFGYCYELESLSLSEGLKEIKRGAFSGTDIESIYIPSTVKKIGRYIFSSCDELEEIVVDSNNEVYDSRNNCNAIIETATNKLIVGCKGSTIPYGVEIIEEDAFWDCEISSVILPDTVVEIKNEAFGYCDDLESIYISSSVQTINYQAFYGCDNIETINVDTDNLYYDSRNNCNAIIETDTDRLVLLAKDEEIPSFVKELGSRSIPDREKLFIPNSVLSTDNTAFDNLNSVEEIVIEKGSTITLESYQFGSCYNLCEIYIPSTCVINCDGQSLFNNWENAILIVTDAKSRPSNWNKNFNKSDYNKIDVEYGVDYDDYINASSSTVYNLPLDLIVDQDNNGNLIIKTKDRQYLKAIKEGQVVLYKGSYASGNASTENASYDEEDYEYYSSVCGDSFSYTDAYTLSLDSWYLYSYNDYYYDYTNDLLVKIETDNYYTKIDRLTLMTQYRIYMYYDEGYSNYSYRTYFKTSDTFTLETPYREGYTFKGWYTNRDYRTGKVSGTKVTKIAKGTARYYSLFAKWELNTYKITYSLNGGSYYKGIDYLKSFNVNTLTTENNRLNNPYRKGYAFVGWLDTEYSKYYDDYYVKRISLNDLRNYKLKAVWKPIEYTVNFEAAGQDTKSLTCKYDTSYKLDNNVFEEDGKYVSKWQYSYIDTKGKLITKTIAGNASIKNLCLEDGDEITLRAVEWANYKYTIKYVLNSGKNNKLNKSSFTSLDTVYFYDPTRTGVDFIGWYLDPNFTEQAYSTDGIYKNITLYARWNLYPYSINYELDGGDNPESNPYIYIQGASFTFQKPTRQGYTFLKWIDEDTQKPITSITTKANRDYNLKATWKENKYTITYNANGGTKYSGTSLKRSSIPYTYLMLEDGDNLFYRYGYECVGWSTNKNATEPDYASYETQPNLPKTSLTLYAVWQRWSDD